MNDRNIWELLGMLLAAIFILSFALAVLISMGDRDEPQPDLPLVNAAGPINCAPLPPRRKPAGHVDCNAPNTRSIV